MPFCSKCGTNVADGMAFCPACGAPVKAPAASAPPPPAPAGSVSPKAAPAPAPPPGAYPPPAASAPLASNVAGLLTYIAGVVTGIVFLVIEPYNKDKFVRFHAFQSIFFCVAWVIVEIVFSIVIGILTHISFGIFGLLWFLGPLIGLGFFLMWLFLMFKAYNNERFMLPIIGAMAAKQAGS
jgi:uncharacterized membrane protein